jgi:hypothetical protein
MGATTLSATLPPDAAPADVLQAQLEWLTFRGGGHLLQYLKCMHPTARGNCIHTAQACARARLPACGSVHARAAQACVHASHMRARVQAVAASRPPHRWPGCSGVCTACTQPSAAVRHQVLPLGLGIRGGEGCCQQRGTPLRPHTRGMHACMQCACLCMRACDWHLPVSCTTAPYMLCTGALALHTTLCPLVCPV